MKGRRPKSNQAATGGTAALYLTTDAPAEMIGETARARWASTIQTLADENRKLPRSHEGILIGFCGAFQLLSDSEESIQRDGLLIEAGREGRKRNPALSSKIQALGLIRAYAAEIGLSPASASRLPLPPIEEERNPFADL